MPNYNISLFSLVSCTQTTDQLLYQNVGKHIFSINFSPPLGTTHLKKSLKKNCQYFYWQLAIEATRSSVRYIYCSLLKERKNILFCSIGLSEHRHTCLLQNLYSSKIRGFRSEVSIFYPTFSSG